MNWIKEQIEDMAPGIFVYSITIGKTSQQDRISSFYDDLNRQVYWEVYHLSVDRF